MKPPTYSRYFGYSPYSRYSSQYIYIYTYGKSQRPVTVTEKDPKESTV